MVAVVIFSTISHALARGVKDSGLGAVDRSLGFVFGLVRGAVIVCLIFLIIRWAIDDEPKPRWIAEARALPLVEKGAEMLVALVPENIRSDADRAAAAARRKAEDEFKQKALERLTSPPPKDTNTNSNAPDQESGYTDDQRREMLKAIRGISDNRAVCGRRGRDHLNEECAVFGVFGGVDAGALTALGLHALQHRGQEATGIVTFDGEQFHAHRGNGHVSENFGAHSMATSRG